MPPRPIVSGCAALETPLPIPTSKEWKKMRKAYAETKGRKVSKEKLKKEGMVIPHKVGYDEIRGRGVYATELIQNGTRLWRPAQLAHFSNRKDLVTFLKKLPHQLQCDILLWAYPEDGKAHLDLDVGSFVNHGDTPEVLNMDLRGYATRDIEPGEFIVMNYTDFIDYNSVPWFDEIRNEAWKQDTETTVYQTTSDYNQLGAPNSNVGGSINQILNEIAARTDSLGNREMLLFAAIFLFIITVLYKFKPGFRRSVKCDKGEKSK